MTAQLMVDGRRLTVMELWMVDQLVINGAVVVNSWSVNWEYWVALVNKSYDLSWNGVGQHIFDFHGDRRSVPVANFILQHVTLSWCWFSGHSQSLFPVDESENMLMVNNMVNISYIATLGCCVCQELQFLNTARIGLAKKTLFDPNFCCVSSFFSWAGPGNPEIHQSNPLKNPDV